MAKRKRPLDNKQPNKPSKKAKPPSQRPQPHSSSVSAAKPTIPFSASDRILLIGEGDFSFAKSIVEQHGCYNVTATCFDSREDLFQKYSPQAEQNVEYLEDEGQRVLYRIDATKLDSCKALKKAGRDGGGFDRIVFNFPHVGGITKDVNRQVRFNQELIVKFFTAASKLLSPSTDSSPSTILITLFEGSPYSLWNIKDLARHCDLSVQISFKFLAAKYPGYRHARTLGNLDGGGGWKGEDREARTFVFRLRDAASEPKASTRKSRNESDDDDESDSVG